MLLATIGGGSITSTALAGSYTLVDGAGIPVCEAYRRNFEPRHDVEPMACERSYDPAIRGFANVQWRRLDLRKHFQLYRDAELILATNTGMGGQGMVLSDSEAAEMARSLEAKARHLRVELYVARVPLFGPDRPVNILNVREVGCGPMPKPSVKISRLFVLDDSLERIDTIMQEQLEGWGLNGSIEIYNGEPYIEAYEPDDNWSTLLTGNGALSIGKFEGFHFDAICKIAFNRK